MLGAKDFENEIFKDQTMKIHTEVSLAVSERLKNQDAWHHRKTGDQCWLMRKTAKKSLNVLDQLDIFLEQGTLDAYLEQHTILWELLKELELVVEIHEKIARKFGAKCFFVASGL